MADVSKVEVNGSEYDIVDERSRANIEELQNEIGGSGGAEKSLKERIADAENKIVNLEEEDLKTSEAIDSIKKHSIYIGDDGMFYAEGGNE